MTDIDASAATPADRPAEERIGVEELRTLFLFESLDEEKLRWLAEHGRVESYAAGADVCTEGEPGTCFFVLLQGTVTLSRLVHGDEVEMVRTDQRGVYGGALQAYLGIRTDPVYPSTMRAVTDCRFFVMPAQDFARAIRDWFPLAMHLLEGVYLAMRNSQELIGQRERLLALGALSAGLTHELNNPAAAAVRATAALRERVAGMRHKLAMLAQGHLDPAHLPALVQLQEAAAERVGKTPPLSALEASDAEDELADWLDEQGVQAAWDIAPALVGGGIEDRKAHV